MVGTLCKCKLKQNDFKSFLTDIQLNTAQQQKYIVTFKLILFLQINAHMGMGQWTKYNFI